MNNTLIEKKMEIPWIHFVRVLACMMVVCMHSLPLPEMYVLSGFDASFSHLVVVVTKPCVPLFFMITGYLILPIKEKGQWGFYKKRIPRVLYPLLIWGIISSLVYFIFHHSFSEFLKQLILSPVKNPNVVLWYLYMLIGIYLIIPFISSKVYEDKRMMSIFLSIWTIASFLCIFKVIYPDIRNEFILGSNHWQHDFDMTIYFSGYLGYVLLGCAIKEYPEFKKPIILVRPSGGGRYLYLLIYITILFISCTKSIWAVGVFSFLTTGTLFMTYLLFIIFSDLHINTSSYYYKIIKELSKMSFGIYLTHIFIYQCATIELYSVYGTTCWVQMMVMLINIIAAYLVTKGLSYFKFGKYIIG